MLTGRVDVCWKEQTCQPGLGVYWGKDVDGSCRRLLERANLSARIGVKTLTGRVDFCWKEQTCQPGLG